MKTACSIVFILALGASSAQKPEQIYPNARLQKSVAYLKEQSQAWKKETEKEPKNANAWYNYYYANRNLGFNDQSRTPAEKDEVVKKIIEEMGKAIPESYEYNLCKWMSGGWNMKLIAYLEKAQKLGPDRDEHLDYSIIFAEMKGDKKMRDHWCRKKFEAGQFSTGLVYYNYNVLSGLPQNAILVTTGDNDTFPIWYLQSLGIRPDVTILHAMLVNIDEYRKPVFASLGIDEWRKPAGQGRQQTPDLVTHAAGNSRNAPVYLALTATQCLKEPSLENMYLTGLAYVYSKSPLDNVAFLKRNFEQQYALDYIDKQFFPDISPGLVKAVNGNYIVPMLKLYEHYKLAGEQQRMEWIKRLLLTVAKDTKQEDEVRKEISKS
jgi:hypothetical protein